LISRNLTLRQRDEGAEALERVKSSAINNYGRKNKRLIEQDISVGRGVGRSKRK
jgi:hypothetical protein